MADTPQQKPPAPKILMQLVVTLDENQQLLVNGDLGNQLMAYGLLEMAKVAIQNMAAEAQRRVQIAPAGLAGMFKKDS